MWELKDDRPIYLQLMEQVTLRIVSGVYPPGSKLPAVRDLAAEAAVNPNTMQKAMGELEQSGLVYSQRTAGRFITEDETMIMEAKRSIAKEHIQVFLARMSALGITKNESVQLLQKAAEEAE